MKRFLAAFSILAVVILLGLVVSQRLWEKEPVAAPELVFTRPGVVEVHSPGKAQAIEIYDAAGRLVARAPTYGRPVTEVRFPWQPGSWYRALADEGPSTTPGAPPVAPEFLVRLHAPLGQAPREYAFGKPFAENAQREMAVPAGPGETVDLMLEIEKLTDAEPIVFPGASEIKPTGSRGGGAWPTGSACPIGSGLKWPGGSTSVLKCPATPSRSCTRRCGFA